MVQRGRIVTALLPQSQSVDIDTTVDLIVVVAENLLRAMDVGLELAILLRLHESHKISALLT